MGLGHIRRMSVALRPRQREEGAAAVEYGLIVALLAAAIVVSLSAVGGRVNVVFVTIFRAIR